MELTIHGHMKRNKVYTKLEKLTKKYPEILDKYNLKECPHCDGSGLANYQKLSTGDYSWDGVSFCDECDGTGYGPWENIEKYIFELFEAFFCSKCGGDGCRKCSGTGFVDWITHARGG
jgi:DnaJ-class molecular chaperone